MKKILIISRISSELWKRQESLYRIVNGAVSNLYDYQKPNKILRSKSDVIAYYGCDPVIFSKSKTDVRFVSEPIEIEVPNVKKFTKYSHVYMPDMGVYELPTYSQACLPWHLGINFSVSQGIVNLSATDLHELVTPKTKKISIIISSKSETCAQKRRLQVGFYLKDKFGDRIEIYGRGIRTVPDKYSVLKDSSIHVAMENSRHDHYWSEKLADPILARNFVFYFGSQILPKEFESVEVFDIFSPLNVISDQFDAFVKKVDSLDFDSKEALLTFSKLELIQNQSLHSVLEKL